jgi:diadenosine tetraphosphate (Ap4A) HIT family hydrolase
VDQGGWQLHANLARDCHVLGRLEEHWLLLHRNASLHWFILVPQTRVLDLLDLPSVERELLLASAAQIGQLLKARLGYPRVNVGALGLLVPQLHLHVIGRREGDPCWPGPVWGALPPGPAYDDAALADIRQMLGPRLHRVAAA